MSDNKETQYKPTLAQVYAWWRECEDHMDWCNDESCEWYYAFAAFLDLNKLEQPAKKGAA